MELSNPGHRMIADMLVERGNREVSEIKIRILICNVLSL
jgi:hypothetical protein